MAKYQKESYFTKKTNAAFAHYKKHINWAIAYNDDGFIRKSLPSNDRLHSHSGAVLMHLRQRDQLVVFVLMPL